jgi:hypothetical protein
MIKVSEMKIKGTKNWNTVNWKKNPIENLENTKKDLRMFKEKRKK